MNPVDPDGPDGGPDELDARVLREVRALWEAADPVPGDLLDRIRFAVELADHDVEVAWPAEHREVAGVRGDVRSRLVTFTGDALDFVVNAQSLGDGTLRVDGWVSPPGAHPVEVRTPSGTLRTASDDEGRFALERVPAGLVQFVIRPEGRGGAVSTPTMTL
ncbi:hypothetical protein [Saccharothrix algeriensis]|uniref:Carboxypeptidase regulatory-like domain-containing protein n=1 Tax=Saccharothrix algeriensis TaxID=173560 RepID=A0A8T8HZ47_9PSEU|nr:hypothetical protein [Saccharothrix algeriensis]MBM7809312.1 hypothetical protein [Saccharothrix algeriensis]QTR03657.1 hypothetical protein J7S33_00940 [Saccharothrix algeriensis]